MVSEILTQNLLKPQLLLLMMVAGFMFFFRDEIRGRIRGGDKEKEE